MLRLRKLYVDCVGEDGSVCIAYVSSLDAFGLGIAPAGIEHYDTRGRHAIRRGRALLSLAREPAADALSVLQFELDGRRAVLELEPEQDALPLPEGAPPGLRWCVKLARARVHVRDLRGPGDVFSGTGYADWVELARMPRGLGLLQLDWGRVHLPGASVIYTALERSRGPAFRSATFWPRGGTPRAIEQFSLSECAQTGTQRLRLEQRGGALELELRPERALHQGSAVDAARFPSRIERGLSRAVAGPTRERRWLSRARCAELGAGFAVHESVRFGRLAAERSGA